MTPDGLVTLPPIVVTPALVAEAPAVSASPFQAQAPFQLPAAASSAIWTGYGPPDTVIGATPGDEYLDVLTGSLYQLT